MTVPISDCRARQNRPVSVVTVTPPHIVSVHSTQQLRAQVGQALPDDDAALTAYEAVAVDVVAGIIGRPVIACVRRAWFDVVTNPLHLTEPVTSIVSVTCYGPDDQPTIIDPSVYQVDESPRARVFLSSGQSWPAVRTSRAVAVEYTSGWGVTEIPEPVRAAVLVLVAEQYARREASSGQKLEAVPFGVHALLQPYVTTVGVA